MKNSNQKKQKNKIIKINYSSNKTNYGFDIERLSKKIAKVLFDAENIKYDVSFSLSFVTAKKIKLINKSERKIDKITDVLSFPNIDFDKPSNFKHYIGKDWIDISIFDPNSKTIFLGDVLICKEIMEKQAKIYGHSIKREFAFLLTHSLFHLLGYDHIKKYDEKVMFEKQKKILSLLKINN